MSLDVDKTGRILTVTMNRPEALNALDPETGTRMREVFDDFREDDGLWAAILTGAGEKAFCAGADIKKTIASVLDESAWVQRKSYLGGRDVYHALENQTKPILAAVNGYALGGGLELALCCDIRIASETASLGLPEVSIGIMPGAGGTQRLSRVVGMARALDLVLTGERIDARAALAIGLVTRVVPPGELMKTVRELAENILPEGPPRRPIRQGGGPPGRGDEPRRRPGLREHAVHAPAGHARRERRDLGLRREAETGVSRRIKTRPWGAFL